MNIQIIINNNEHLLEKTLPTIPDHCSVSIIKDSSKNRSKIRNNNAKNQNFYLEPGEEILVWQDFTGLGFCEVINNDIITKETRLWTKQDKFTSYETIKGVPQRSGIVISSSGNDLDLHFWRKEDPLNADFYYYSAFSCLKEQKLNNFIQNANIFLLQDKDLVKTTMIRYYLAIIYSLQGKLDLAIKNLIVCLSNNILMAEFWCLLGDIYLTTKESYKSVAFYKNALLLGSQRLENDLFPIQISKYSSYPNEMLSKLLKSSKDTP